MAVLCYQIPPACLRFTFTAFLFLSHSLPLLSLARSRSSRHTFSLTLRHFSFSLFSLLLAIFLSLCHHQLAFLSLSNTCNHSLPPTHMHTHKHTQPNTHTQTHPLKHTHPHQHATLKSNQIASQDSCRSIFKSFTQLLFLSFQGSGLMNSVHSVCEVYYNICICLVLCLSFFSF